MAWHKSKNILPLTFAGASLFWTPNIKPHANRRNNVGQQLSTLLDVTCYVRLHTLLRVVTRCWELLRKVWNRSNVSANNSQHFFNSVIVEAQQCWIPVHSSSNIAHYTWSIWRLQGLMGCILPTMQCRSQHCRITLHITANTDATTPNTAGNVVGPNSHESLNVKFTGHIEKAYSGTIKQPKSP